MKSTRFSTHSSQFRKRFVAATLLALTLASGPLLAAGEHESGVRSAQTSGASSPQESSSSRINGRIDWDIDYPSQLAPQRLPPSRNTNFVTTITRLSSADSNRMEWEHPSP